MKTFRQYISELQANVPVISINRTMVDLDDPETVNEMNKNLSVALATGFSELGEALNKAKKILTMYGVEIGKVEDTYAKKGSLSIPISRHKSSGENHKNVTKPFGEFDEEHTFKFDFELIDGVYKIDAEVVKK